MESSPNEESGLDLDTPAWTDQWTWAVSGEPVTLAQATPFSWGPILGRLSCGGSLSPEEGSGAKYARISEVGGSEEWLHVFNLH